MKLHRKTQRTPNAINAGSMADVAFLLLIFFLVSTSIFEENGIQHILPPYKEEQISSKTTNKIIRIIINQNNEVLLNGELIKLNELSDFIIDFIENPSLSKEKASSPDKAAIVFSHHENIPYETYAKTYATISHAYLQMRNNASQKKFQKPLKKLSSEEQFQIKKRYPLNISELSFDY